MLVWSSEMPGPCALDSLQMRCGSDSFDHGMFLNFGIYACHTPVTELESTFENNYAGNTPKNVLARDTLRVRWQNDQWSGFGFDRPFRYDGSDNLILEFRWQGDDGNAAYDRGWYTPGNRAVDGRSLTAPQGTPRNYMPRFRIFYNPTGVGEHPATPVRGRPEILAAPNPFRDRVSIRLTDGSRARELQIRDAGGRLVRSLPVNRGTAVWDGCDDCGARVPVGRYFGHTTGASLPILSLTRQE